MSYPFTLQSTDKPPRLLRVQAWLAVALARPLLHRSPACLRAVLGVLRKGAGPASYDQALAARTAVVAVSVRCAGQGCLQRSLATVLLCRMRGTWPTWCSGIRTQPFRAHAWIEAEGQPVDEPHPPGYFTITITVTPVR